ncbi:MAG: glutamine-hydrolyzing GMP synthase [Chloroflexota bacterium]|nr:glutamine-hydrolyzing GMP synthase [Chloroflexota bacterium]
MHQPSTREAVAILDFGSQYSQLIARRVREANVYCELFRWDAPAERVLALRPRGFILSGGPASVYEDGAPVLPDYVLRQGIPVLGICYGMQLLTHALGGRVSPANEREYGPAELTITNPTCPLFTGLAPEQSGSSARDLSSLVIGHCSLNVWMSHGDRIEMLPPGFAALATTANSPIAAMGHPQRQFYGLQFHPEVVHTSQGQQIIRNFLFDVCGLHGTWTAGSFIEEAVARIRAQVGAGRVVCGLSGGVDSAVTAALVHCAVGEQLTCIFVDTGLLRRGEPQQVVDTFRREQGIALVAVDAGEEFLAALAGVTDPEQKRRIIGEKFVRVFEREARKLGRIDFLAQGTIYPDVIESAGRPYAQRIKTHHNVGGLPEDMHLKLVEPLRELFKDEVRAAGEELGLPEDIVWRHPFPGPGLAVRIVGEVTPERVRTLQAADAIVLEELRAAGWYRRTAQAFAVLLPVRSVGVMGDGRAYGHVVAVRAVTTDDFMTASWARLPYEVLSCISTRIVNEVAGVTRVVYDVSDKPPATIEWE